MKNNQKKILEIKNMKKMSYLFKKMKNNKKQLIKLNLR